MHYAQTQKYCIIYMPNRTMCINDAINLQWPMQPRNTSFKLKGDFILFLFSGNFATYTIATIIIYIAQHNNNLLQFKKNVFA